MLQAITISLQEGIKLKNLYAFHSYYVLVHFMVLLAKLNEKRV